MQLMFDFFSRVDLNVSGWKDGLNVSGQKDGWLSDRCCIHTYTYYRKFWSILAGTLIYVIHIMYAYFWNSHICNTYYVCILLCSLLLNLGSLFILSCQLVWCDQMTGVFFWSSYMEVTICPILVITPTCLSEDISKTRNHWCMGALTAHMGFMGSQADPKPPSQYSLASRLITSIRWW